jgi:hypothetical protein
MSLSKIVQESVSVLDDEAFCCSADYCHKDCHDDKKAVVIKALISSQISLLEAVKNNIDDLVFSTPNDVDANSFIQGRRYMKDYVITYLQEQISLIKKMV